MQSYGYSLMELLISLFLGSLLMSVSMKMYLHYKIQYRTLEAQYLDYEELRLARFHINSWIRMAAYAACDKKARIEEGIKGYRAENLPKTWGISAKKGTDVLLIRSCFWYQDHWQWLPEIIFIRKTSRQSKNGKALYGLYVKKWMGRSEEIATNINDLQILYGLRDSETPEVSRYAKSNEVQDWGFVISVDYWLNKKFPSYIALRQRND